MKVLHKKQEGPFKMVPKKQRIEKDELFDILESIQHELGSVSIHDRNGSFTIYGEFKLEHYMGALWIKQNHFEYNTQDTLYASLEHPRVIVVRSLHDPLFFITFNFNKDVVINRDWGK
jgi:hypothetical protein